MSDHVHAVPRNSQPQPGRCHWIFTWEDVLLRCDELVLPGEPWCPDHLIAIQPED